MSGDLVQRIEWSEERREWGREWCVCVCACVRVVKNRRRGKEMMENRQTWEGAWVEEGKDDNWRVWRQGKEGGEEE